MRRRRVMRRSVALVAVALLLLAPAAAFGQEAPRTDPEAGSPAETVYGIPLEEARRDAAPGLVPGSAIRTEEGVGSSVRVPGRGGPPALDEPSVDSERAAERRRERRRQAARAATRISGDPSAAATATVLVLVVAVAAAGGVGAGRLVGRRARL